MRWGVLPNHCFRGSENNFSNWNVASSVSDIQDSHCPFFPTSHLAVLIFNWWCLPKAGGYLYLLPEEPIFYLFKELKKHSEENGKASVPVLTTSRQSCRVKRRHQETLRSKTSPEQPFSLCWVYPKAQFSVLCRVRHKAKTAANSTRTNFFGMAMQHGTFCVVPLELMFKTANRSLDTGVGALHARGKKVTTCNKLEVDQPAYVTCKGLETWFCSPYHAHRLSCNSLYGSVLFKYTPNRDCLGHIDAAALFYST